MCFIKLLRIEEVILIVNNNSLRALLLCTINFLTCAVLLTLCTVNPAIAQTTEQIAEKALASTVFLEMKDSNGNTLGIGMGFFVKSDLIATNYHVIEGASTGTAKLIGKYTKYNIEGVTATDMINDLVLLKVTTSGINPLPLSASNATKIGATIYVAGNPKGLKGTFSDGIISRHRYRNTKERLQITTSNSPRSVGRPVFNTKGEVIGITTISIESGEFIDLVITSNYLKMLLNKSGLVKPLSQDYHSISANTYFTWGYVKYQLGDYDGAISDFTHSIRLNPNYAPVYYVRGYVKGTLEQFNLEIADYNNAIRIKPDYVQAYVARGYAKGKLGQDYAAITDYNNAIRIQPDFVQAYLNRGAAKGRLGQYKLAVTDFDTAIRLKPDFAEAYYSRGHAKGSLGQFNSEIADYDIAIRLKPNFIQAYLNRGYVKTRLGQFNSAIADFDIIIRLRPNFADVYYYRGIAKGELKQYKSAIADFDRTIRLKPDSAQAYFNRGLAKSRIGQMSKGKQDMLTALKLAEQNSDENLKAHIKSIIQKIQ